MTPIPAGGLAAVFKVLANDTRLRLLHALVRADELCVINLAAAVGAVIALEALFVGPVSGASMNPTRSLAAAVVAGRLDHL